jgi:hypothetical protein
MINMQHKQNKTSVMVMLEEDTRLKTYENHAPQAIASVDIYPQ